MVIVSISSVRAMRTTSSPLEEIPSIQRLMTDVSKSTNGQMLKSSELITNTKVTDSYRHQYATVDVPCMFDGAVQISVNSWFFQVAHLWR